MPIAHYAYTALDCPNPWRLAHFYAQITDWLIEPFEEGETEESCEWLELHDSNGRTMMGFQKIDNYKAPTWPSGNLPQQLHMDFHARDLDSTEQKLLAIDARKAGHQVRPDRFRVYLDPVGHPFCILQRDVD